MPLMVALPETVSVPIGMPGSTIEPAGATSAPLSVPLPFNAWPEFSVNVPPTPLTSNEAPVPTTIAASVKAADPLSAIEPPRTVTGPELELTCVSVNVPPPIFVNPNGAAAPSENEPSNSVLVPSVPTVSVPGAVACMLRTRGPSADVIWNGLGLDKFATATLLPYTCMSPAESMVNGPALMALLLAARMAPDVISVEAYACGTPLVVPSVRINEFVLP